MIAHELQGSGGVVQGSAYAPLGGRRHQIAVGVGYYQQGIVDGSPSHAGLQEFTDLIGVFFVGPAFVATGKAAAMDVDHQRRRLIAVRHVYVEALQVTLVVGYIGSEGSTGIGQRNGRVTQAQIQDGTWLR